MIVAAIAALALSADPAAAGPPPLTEVVYSQAPGRREVIAIYPPHAWNHHLSGWATMNCAVDGDGRLKDCRIKSEDPAGQGFAAAALKLAPKYRVAPAHPGETIAGGRIEVPVQFLMPATN